ncbi:MAG: hypothetical protein EBZ77_17205, partial [Chitinophagia bacterium]|nr:hypothetical protein [Chitinophagia bacterium]
MEKELMEQQLWDYIDGLCSPEEAARVRQNVDTLPEWLAAYNEIQSFQATLVQEVTTDAPSLRFSKNVMEQIALTPLPLPTRQYINPIVIRLIASLLLGSLAVCLCIVLFTAQWSTGSNHYWQLPSLSTLPLPKFNSDSVMLLGLVNIVLVVV